MYCRGEKMSEILTIYVEIGKTYEVCGHNGIARMILFSGHGTGSGFQGTILPGGVDTQQQDNKTLALSARYILEGTDGTGQKCRIFIENEGMADGNGNINQTIPKITTDSEALAWMETATLTGTITPWERGVVIHIFAER